MIINVVTLLNADDISEDRFAALRKRAEVDSKYVVFFNPSDTSELETSLNRHAILHYSSFPFYILRILIKLLLSILISVKLMC